MQTQYHGAVCSMTFAGIGQRTLQYASKQVVVISLGNTLLQLLLESNSCIHRTHRVGT